MSSALNPARTLDSSERLVATNARVPILNYQLVDESPAYDHLPDAIIAVQNRGYQLHDVVFINDYRSDTPSPIPGVLLHDPRYAYGDVVRSSIVIAKDYLIPGPEQFRSFKLGAYIPPADKHNPVVISENCRYAVHEVNLNKPNREFNSLGDAIAAAERKNLQPFDTAFVNVSHGGSKSNEPLPIVLLHAADLVLGMSWGDAFIGRVGSQHLLYRWGYDKEGKGASIRS